MRRAAWLAATLAALFAAGTWWALESGGVAVLETTDAAGGTRRTHVWVAEDGREVWIEAATPERRWLDDIRRAPGVVLHRDGGAARFTAVAVPGPGAAGRIRRMLRAKYGVRDRWVGLLQDTSRAVAVRLAPVRDPARRDHEDADSPSDE